MARAVRFVQALMSLLFLVYAADAGATVVVRHGLEEMTSKSDVIVHARVADQKVTREDGRIVTLTEVEVIDGLKGAKPGEVLTIYQVGGSLDGMRQWIEGAHVYEHGEELVLFAMRHGERVVSYGVGVGKFRVVYDGAFRRIVEDIEGVVELKRLPTGEVRMEAPAPREYASLEGFKGEVRGYVARPALPARPTPLKTKRRLGNPLRVKPGHAPVDGGR